MSDNVKYDGVPVKIAGKEYVIPALSFRQIKSLKPQLDTIATISLNHLPSDEQSEAMITVIQTALSRNYPDVTTDEVSDMIDLSNLKTIIDAIMGVSGLVPKGELKVGSVPTGT